MDKIVVIILAVVMFTAGCVIGYVATEPETEVEIEYVETVTWANNTEYVNNTYPVYNNNTEYINNTYPMYNNNTEWVNNSYPVYNNITEYSNNTEWINNTYYVTNESSSSTMTTPAGQWIDVGAITQTSAKLTFGSFTESPPPEDLKFFILANGSAIGDLVIPTNTGAAPQTMTWYMGPPGAGATYFDYNPGGGTINAGDYITMTGLLPGTSYTVTVFHIPSDSAISMVGASGTFNTPP